MAYDAYKVTKAFERLFLTCHLPLTTNDPDGAEKAAAIYYEACQGYTTGAIVDAIEDFTFGRVEGIRQGFAPNVAQFSSHLRSVQSHLNGPKSMHNAAVRQIEQRDHDADIEASRTPEAMAMVRSMVEAFEESIKPKKRTPEEIAKAMEHLGKLDIMFQSQFHEPIPGRLVSSSLLKKLGYETFDSLEEDNHDLGEGQ